MGCQERLAVSEALDLIVVSLQGVADLVAALGVVVDDKDDCPLLRDRMVGNFGDCPVPRNGAAREIGGIVRVLGLTHHVTSLDKRPVAAP